MHRFVACTAIAFTLGTSLSAIEPGQPRTLTLEDRVAAQRAIEAVYWRHRIWPKENQEPKPELELVIPDSAIRAKVEDYLAKSIALDHWWRHPITAEQLQAEMERMGKDTRDPRTLKELFEALGNDSFLIAETLARQTLVERLIRSWYASDPRFQVPQSDQPFDAWWATRDAMLPSGIDETPSAYVLPEIALSDCVSDTWAPTPTEVPDPRSLFSAVWTGAEMIVWGGWNGSSPLNSGGRYNPSTDSWTPTSTGSNVPGARWNHKAVWTGTEMILWGGYGGTFFVNTGGRYNPSTDTWAPTSVAANVPNARSNHTAVWTGTEMIVWGGSYTFGFESEAFLGDGARYNPSTDTWTPTSNGANVPAGRREHTAVWTGAEMLVWGGYWRDTVDHYLNSGGRYNPSSNSWTATSTGTNVPLARSRQTGVWTGTEMIVWGGWDGATLLNTGGRYNPSSNSWTSTSTGANVPAGRYWHSSVWTGTAMIVWGGNSSSTGARYNPSSNSWTSTSIGANLPAGRSQHIAVWTGTEMIVWGGSSAVYLNTGGRYDPSSDGWLPTSTGAIVPSLRSLHTSIWTGAEMVVWGGTDGSSAWNNGGRYTPSTNSWVPTSTGTNVPTARYGHTSVWTGTKMIVWSGFDGSSYTGAGGSYDPATNSWAATSTGANLPAGRSGHASVWTGSEMIVWGGTNGTYLSSGARYDPIANGWTPISSGANVPSARAGHTAIWTGTEMIVWGGNGGAVLNSGARYALATDTWEPTSVGTNVPIERENHSTIWTGTEMLVWGGRTGGGPNPHTGTGGRYDPATDSWTPTAAGPTKRHLHTAIWTGNEMIVWGGYSRPFPAPGSDLNSGGSYDPIADTWTSTSTTDPDLPPPRSTHTAAWTGTEMIVWGGATTTTGGRYCVCGSSAVVYRDVDGDGSGDPALPLPVCFGTVPSGYADNGLDCDDSDPEVLPGALEICNGKDDDCDGGTDNGGSALCNDGDVCTDDACNGVAGCVHVQNAGPCNDGNACTSPDSCQAGACVGPCSCLTAADVDLDAFGDPATIVLRCDASVPPGYVTNAGDCDDTNPSIRPEAPELCNAVDDDCDGTLDDGWTTVVWFADLDEDRYGRPSPSVTACYPPASHVRNARDCDDTDPTILPGGAETCDGNRNDCNALDWPVLLDADTDGTENACETCTDGDGDGWGDPNAPGNVCAPDNCPSVSNPSQSDDDFDGVGDACEACPSDPLDDEDGDGLCGNLDNCPSIPNPGQDNADADPFGDACDPCPLTVESSCDPDIDGDGIPNASDPDDDSDGVPDDDGDGSVDPCRCPCPAPPCAWTCLPLPPGNCDDNCHFDFNRTQRDVDQDGVGDACDPMDDLVQGGTASRIVSGPGLLGGAVTYTFAWQPESGVLGYNVYRGLLSDLAAGSYGTCFRNRIVTRYTTLTGSPVGGSGFFYLVTSVYPEREGSLGYRSDGSERLLASACP